MRLNTAIEDIPGTVLICMIHDSQGTLVYFDIVRNPSDPVHVHTLYVYLMYMYLFMNFYNYYTLLVVRSQRLGSSPFL